MMNGTSSQHVLFNRGSLFQKYRMSTMCSAEVFEANLELAKMIGEVTGAVVECGVWKGGMIAAIAETLGPRRYVLCDSFQGLPPALPIDGPAINEWQRQNPDNCRVDRSYAERAMAMAGVDFEIAEGWFRDTLPNLSVEPIALLRLDADLYESTRDCLVWLFRNVAPGGVIIVDDYYVWDGCALAVHEFLGAQARIRSHGDVAYIVKQ